MTAVLCKLLGACLLAGFGGGTGWILACRKHICWQQTEAFTRFLQYISESIRFRSLPAAAVLAMAAQHPEFAPFCMGASAAFSQLQPPECLDKILGTELREGLSALESGPRQTACDTLQHLIELCRCAGEEMRQTALQTQKLYPRMGACIGLLAAIALA